MNDEITDLWFPFKQQILPLCLTDQAVRDEFLSAQRHAFTDSLATRQKMPVIDSSNPQTIYHSLNRLNWGEVALELYAK